MLTRISCFDQRTTYGRNLKNISDECKVSVDKLNNATVKKLMKFKEKPENEACGWMNYLEPSVET